jgi:tRNA-Thr(GGU) m(6)t(6)A37 methyltransferase TsaA
MQLACRLLLPSRCGASAAARALGWRAAAACPALLRAVRCAHGGGATRGRVWEHRAAVSAGAAWSGDVVTFAPVGVFEGPFRRRNGTPRQGVLAPRCRGVIRLQGDALAHGAADSLSGLEGYSHCVLLFHFHANTPSRAAAKVSPPRLGGARVGVFATRAPHRPNAIGLSVVRVESVQGACLHVSGADLLHGTPILDIKPYVPSYDAHPGATVPDWLASAPDTAPQRVRWSAAALEGLAAAAPSLRFLRGAEDAAAAVEDALRSELRSAYRRTSCADAPYGFYLDVLDVRCVFDDAQRSVEITAVSLSPYEDDEADAAADAHSGAALSDAPLEGGDASDPWRGVAPADAAVFRALLSRGGLAARVADGGQALWRANGVMLGAPVGTQHAGAAVTLRYDWRAARLGVTLQGGGEASLDAHALAASQARGFKPLRTLGLFLLRGPALGGVAWLRRGQKLGVAALWDALAARPPLAPVQFAAWQAAAEAEEEARAQPPQEP